MLTAEDRLILIRVKTEQAKKHLRELETILSGFKNESLYAIVQSEQGTQEFKNLPILSFEAVATSGDVVHNLRSALDHLAWQLVLTAGNEPKPGVTAFPIAKEAAAYESDKGKRVQGMEQRAISAIDALKPYKGGNEMLWKLHELDLIDKHRTVLSVRDDCLFVAGWMPVVGWPYRRVELSPHFSGVFDEEVGGSIQSEIEAAANHRSSGALLPTLHSLVSYIETLIPTFKQYL